MVELRLVAGIMDLRINGDPAINLNLTETPYYNHFVPSRLVTAQENRTWIAFYACPTMPDLSIATSGLFVIFLLIVNPPTPLKCMGMVTAMETFAFEGTEAV